MNRENVIIVGILFYKEDIFEIFDYLEDKNIFTINDTTTFNERLDNGEEIPQIFDSMIKAKNIVNPPVMEKLFPQTYIDLHNSDNYFLGYRINEKYIYGQSNKEANKSQENWLAIFGDVALVEDISFEV